jgi:hypothetical protein
MNQSQWRPTSGRTCQPPTTHHIASIQIRPLPPTFARVRQRPDAPLFTTGLHSPASQVNSREGFSPRKHDRTHLVEHDLAWTSIRSSHCSSTRASSADVNVRQPRSNTALVSPVRAGTGVCSLEEVTRRASGSVRSFTSLSARAMRLLLTGHAWGESGYPVASVRS